MSPGLFNTVMALLFAVTLVCAGWGMSMYFFEMGNDEAKREYKGLLINSLSVLVFLMVLYALLGWVGAALSGFF